MVVIEQNDRALIWLQAYTHLFEPSTISPPVPGTSFTRPKRLLKLIDSWGADGIRRHPVLFQE